jgi:hypothetical protein
VVHSVLEFAGADCGDHTAFGYRDTENAKDPQLDILITS